MSIKNLFKELGFTKDSNNFLKSYHAGLEIKVMLDKDSWFVMPLINVAKLPAPEGLPIDRLIKLELYWPENSYNPEKHTAYGQASDLSAFKMCYANIIELFVRIAKFYDIK